MMAELLHFLHSKCAWCNLLRQKKKSLGTSCESQTYLTNSSLYWFSGGKEYISIVSAFGLSFKGFRPTSF